MFAGTSKRRTQETSSDPSLPDLPHTRPDPPQVRPTFFSASAFDRMLEQLGGVHLRLTLCRLDLDHEAARLSDVAEALQGLTQGVTLSARQLSTNSLLILYVGPRRAGREGDREAERTIGAALEQVLVSHGLEAATGISFAHHWSDALDLRYCVGDHLAVIGTAETSALAAA